MHFLPDKKNSVVTIQFVEYIHTLHRTRSSNQRVTHNDKLALKTGVPQCMHWCKNCVTKIRFYGVTQFAHYTASSLRHFGGTDRPTKVVKKVQIAIVFLFEHNRCIGH